ncbi:hypothetical protein DXC31_02630 [Mediterraneibacter gnavus]|uniref:Mannosyl-glycoprotein endo-beta-N-acetylglucosamidase-like domain-containing protein n=1 Tax=Mediterraneibacter gnavus TaxID=33038 RepID=A0A3E4VCG9_MEDGN|nr:hypothetical protein DXC31_02630 [Mediterraneibacter gnavus]
MAITEKQQRFIEEIAKYVQKYAYVYGILVHSPIIAQAILESGWGESKLAAKYHNYFGLKCGSKWTGKSVNLTTKEEYQPGTLTTIKITSESTTAWRKASRDTLNLSSCRDTRICEASRIQRNTCRQSRTTDTPHRAHTSRATTS